MFSYYNKSVVLSCLFVLAVVLLFFILILPGLGKTTVDIHVAPTDSSVTIDGKPVKGPSVKLKPGSYTFTAKKTAFEDAVEVITVGGEDASVELLPEPVSDQAKAYLIANPEEQALREEIGGKKAVQSGELFRSSNEIIDLLPRVDITGPYAIDYGRATNDNDRAILVVRDSSPKGRQKALQWLREQGFDPVDYEIVFSDYTNIFQQYSEAE